MNCTNLLENLGFTCAPRNGGALRLWSPFTFDDGDHLGLFLEPLDGNQWLVTDHADTMMHVSAMGAKLTKPRLDSIRNRFPGIELTDGGALRTTTSEADLSFKVTSLLGSAMAISHAMPRWLPKMSEERFIQAVGRELQSVAGERLQRGVTVQGVSGHQLEIPFVIDLPNTGRHYIQPVASGDDHVDWNNVYRAGGKMLDLKSAGADDHQRIVVIEDMPDDAELGKAITFLSVTTSVLLFSHRSQWREQFRLAA